MYSDIAFCTFALIRLYASLLDTFVQVNKIGNPAVNLNHILFSLLLLLSPFSRDSIIVKAALTSYLEIYSVQQLFNSSTINTLDLHLH